MTEKLERAFQDLFRVWDRCSVRDATNIVEDCCRTIGHQVFGYTGAALDEFERRCGGPR